MKHELAFAKGATQSGYELAAKDTAQNSDGQEETRARRDPAGVVGRQAAAGHNSAEAMLAGVLTPSRKATYAGRIRQSDTKVSL